MKPILSNQFVRFFLVGTVNTAFGYLVFAGLVFAGLGYPVAALASTVSGAVFDFKTLGYAVFGRRGNSRMARFFAAFGLVYAFNVLGIWYFNGLGLTSYVSGLIMTMPVGLTSFLLNKYWVFKG
jgi:putative flippase GtrA